MIVGSDNIITWFKGNDAPYWRILSGEKGGVIMQGDNENEILTVDDSLVKFQNALKLLSSGTYFVDNWKRGQNQNSRFKTRFGLNQSDVSPIDSMALNTAPVTDVQAEIAKAVEDFKNKLEIERLRVENAELTKEVNSSTFKVMNRLEPYLGTIVEGLFPNAQGIGEQYNRQKDTPQTEEEMQDLDPQEKLQLETALGDWSESDPDLLTLISKISKLAKEDPDTYKMAKTMLMNK